ncbi:hypothetical protein JYU19_02440 [bacterium AH-315-J21]|nr:hypothetical protein [bacterium AH-315-J21]
MNTLKLTGPSLSRPLRKRTLWTTAIILSLALALSPPQTSFAKNTPVQSPAEIGVPNNGGGGFEATGVTDGGGGATGPIERVAEFPTGKSKSPTSTLYSPEDSGGSYGVTFLEWSFFDYYKVVIESFFLSLSFPSSELTSYTGETQHE